MVYYVSNETYVVRLHPSSENSVGVSYLPGTNRFGFIFACKLKTFCVLRITVYVCCVREKNRFETRNVLRFKVFFNNSNLLNAYIK